MKAEKRFWFAAAPFGFGWWRPSHGLGWLTVVLVIALVLLVSRQFPPMAEPLKFWASIVAVVAAFLLVCKIKGEPLGKRRA